jgi:endonuclease/exonuclease/phosphatase (EEP) superfamily protein YafD
VIATAAVAGIAAIVILGAVVAPTGGLPGLLNLLSGHLAIAALVFLPVLLLTRSRALVVAFGVLLVVVGTRFGDEWLSLPPCDAAADLRVATWNLEFGAVGIAAGLDGLRALQDGDVGTLQELTPEQAAAIEADPAITAAFPFRALAPAPGTAGIGLLAGRPLADVEVFADPIGMRASLDVDSDRIVIHTAHPYPASIGTWSSLRIPIAYDPSARDAALTRLRERMEPDLTGDGPVVLLGDFNVAPTEPGYAPLALGLTDAHRAVGIGTGWTWRPSRFEFLGLGLLRIDDVFSRGLDPVAIATDCTRPGDHCLVIVDLALP